MINHMKRTTLLFDEEMFAKLKKLAAEKRRTLTEVVHEVVWAGLQAFQKTHKRRRVNLPSFNAGIPKINIADRNQLEEAMGDRWRSS